MVALRRAHRRIVRIAAALLQDAAVFEIDCDAGRPEAMIAEVGCRSWPRRRFSGGAYAIDAEGQAYEARIPE